MTVCAPTLGVEEEFLLLDPLTGAVAPVAPQVIPRAGAPRTVGHEVMRYMVETRTPVCRALDEAHEHLALARLRLARAAASRDVAAVPIGVPPWGLPGEALVTDAPRYAELQRRFPRLVRLSGTCSCHVHVGVPDRRLAVEALLRIRPWLPALLALTASSPVWSGRDSGWASRRFPLISGWPTVRPPPVVRSLEEYVAHVRSAVATGLALDERSVYYLARLSPRYPTIEVRVADACLTVDQTTAYAGVVRALVATALEESARRTAPPPLEDHRVVESCWSAARHGLAGDLLDPRSGELAPTRSVLQGLLDVVRPALGAWGEETLALGTLARHLEDGGGAGAHRRALRAADTAEGFVRTLTDLSTPRA